MSLLLKIHTPLRISFDFIPDQLYWLELLRIETKVFPQKKKKVCYYSWKQRYYIC